MTQQHVSHAWSFFSDVVVFILKMIADFAFLQRLKSWLNRTIFLTVWKLGSSLVFHAFKSNFCRGRIAQWESVHFVNFGFMREPCLIHAHTRIFSSAINYNLARGFTLSLQKMWLEHTTYQSGKTVVLTKLLSKRACSPNKLALRFGD